MTNLRILWADDEIDLLKPQLLYLEKRGHNVTTVTNAHDALEEAQETLMSYFSTRICLENQGSIFFLKLKLRVRTFRSL